MSAFGWKVHGDGKTLERGAVVAPDERLSWGRTAGLGAQHVVAMFGATFVFPIIMGLNPQLAIMMSGIATIAFLLIVNGKVPSYLGTSAAFVGGVAAVTAQGGTPQQVTGSIFVAGIVLTLAGIFIHLMGAATLTKMLPPVVTGAVVMLIGFNLAPVVANIYWPQDQWIAMAVMVVTILAATVLPGFWGRISVLLGLVFGYVASWIADLTLGPVTGLDANTGEIGTHYRVDWSGVVDAPWFGFPPATDTAAGVVGWHLPDIQLTFVLLMIPAVVALVAENVGHVKAVQEMTGADLDPYVGRAVAADGVGTMIATSVGGSPTTTYAENIGVMASTRVYSTAAYYMAALVALVFGMSPKFGAVVSAVPGGVLGGITVVLYGMIGLLGAKIWVENRVDFSQAVNLVPISAGIIIAIGDTALQVSDDFSLAGIAFGTIVTIAAYHVVRFLMPKAALEAQLGAATMVETPGLQDIERQGIATDYGLYGHRILGRTPEGHLIVEEKASDPQTADSRSERPAEHGAHAHGRRDGEGLGEGRGEYRDRAEGLRDDRDNPHRSHDADDGPAAGRPDDRGDRRP